MVTYKRAVSQPPVFLSVLFFFFFKFQPVVCRVPNIVLRRETFPVAGRHSGTDRPICIPIWNVTTGLKLRLKLICGPMFFFLSFSLFFFSWVKEIFQLNKAHTTVRCIITLARKKPNLLKDIRVPDQETVTRVFWTTRTDSVSDI